MEGRSLGARSAREALGSANPARLSPLAFTFPISSSQSCSHVPAPYRRPIMIRRGVLPSSGLGSAPQRRRRRRHGIGINHHA